MLGLLINGLRKSSDTAVNLSNIVLFGSDVFGKGTDDYTVPASTTKTMVDLVDTNKTLSYKNVTIEEGGKLTPVRNGVTGGNGFFGFISNNRVSAPGPYHSLFLQCSDTLTVKGSITSKNCGGSFYYWNNANYTMKVKTPGLIEYTFPDSNGNKTDRQYGASAAYYDWLRLQQYGFNFGFMDYQTFMVGGGGGGCHKYTTGSGPFKDTHHERSVHKGIACGGNIGWNQDYRCGGAGGFVALYFNELIINGKVYGVDSGCDISKISANGYFYSGSESNSMGGGSMVIAAKRIVIEENGSINSDAGGSGTGKYSFLNNFPQVCETSAGYYWDPETSAYKLGIPPNDTYWYDDGIGGGLCNTQRQGTKSAQAGGGGVVLGYKVKV